MKTPLILASSSPFRQSILKKLMLPFMSFSPDIDERAREDESAEQLVARLSELKAQASIKKYQKGIVIGSDQVALFDGEILGKPYNKENAVKQLSLFSNNRVTFLTGLTVFDIQSGKTLTNVVPFHVYFRKLTQMQINNYCDAEAPYNCAGSFKSEGLGICLFDKLEGEDPNTLIGLPLIQLTKMLLEFGVDVLAEQSSQ
ncbi:septum formation inhibitor Maf [Pseudoalteromonas sp. SCSIO 43201]|uniref:Maf family protein n=1 Tax=Pseudoalteromonas sp. SCSIO 43201 TaxID=2822842 RepID=UPI0020753F9A|nr:nucleoside triphosphate pyrophosphatase [Pseudoalteromonas sp. SCSIO 43201]USD29722.1 septum formation inhibitor Maf [Pseudoalteromonas sp. SCSIO 43201]